MYVIFEGLDDLIKESEKIANQSELDKLNKKILQKCGDVVAKELKPKVTRSKDVSRSGNKGSRTFEHAADNINVSKIKNTKGTKFIFIGWKRGKNAPFNYMQYEEWGNTTRPPKPMLHPTIEEVKPELNEIAVKEYEELINKLK